MTAGVTEQPPPLEAEAPSRARRPADVLRSPRVITLLALVGLLAVTALGYAWYVSNGGLYSDDWAMISEVLHPAHGGWWSGVEELWGRASYRPVSVAYYPVVFGLLGGHATLELLWSVGVTFAFAALLFGVLRSLSMKPVHAFAIAALVLLTPTGDSVVLWPSATPIRFAGALYLGGLLVALSALRLPEPRRAWRRHAFALVLYLAAIWTYELTAALTAAGLLTYLVAAPRGRALRHWAADMAVTVPAMAWTLTHTPKHVQTLDQQLDHGRLIAHQLWDIYDDVALPSSFPAHAAAVLTVVAAIAGTVFLGLLARGRLGGPATEEARGWAITGAIGFVYLVAAYIVFVPADPYYSPAAVNFGNRVNGVGIAALVVVAYSAVMLLTTLVLSWRPRCARAAFAVAAVYVVAMVITHNDALRDHERLYVQASALEDDTLDTMQRLLPSVPPGTYVVAVGVPPFVAPDLPVFASTWDMQGAVRERYRDGSLSGFNAAYGLQCADTGLAIAGAEGAGYGRAAILDMTRRKAWVIRDLAGCQRILEILSKPA
jgi:hypothetical protein